MQTKLQARAGDPPPRREDAGERLAREVARLRQMALQTQAGLAAALEALKASNEA